MTVTDICPPAGIPRPELAGLREVSQAVLAIVAPHAGLRLLSIGDEPDDRPAPPRPVMCVDGRAAEPMTSDELDQIRGYCAVVADSGAEVARLLATVEALRVAP